MLLDDHLRNSLATQRLAANKFLLLQGRERIENTRDEKDDGSSDQARGWLDQTDPLNDTQ